MPDQFISIGASFLLTVFLFQLRFLPQMTVAVWTRLWGSLAPLLMGSLFTLPMLPFAPTLTLVCFLIIGIGIWAAYRFYPLLIDKRLHKSRFARLDEMETLFERKPCADGLVLGRVRQFLLFHHYVCVRPTQAKKEIGNSLILAPTGAGKGNQIRGQIVAFEGSMIINDPKGDLFLTTAGDRAKKGQVFVLDPTRGVGHCYDPLSGKTEEGEYLTVARNLVFDPSTHDTYWDQSASRMIIHLFKAARRENVPPFVYLRHMIDGGLPAVAKRLHRIDPRLATAFLGADIDEANLENNRTLFGIWSTLQTRLTPFLTETLVRVFTKSDFSAETIMRGKRPVTVYLRLEEAHLERLSPFVRIMVESLVKELMACWDTWQGKGCRKVLLSLDELGITPIPSLAKFVATGRSRDIIFQLFYQAPSQLEKNYGREDARTIMANMDTTTFFRPNYQDDAREIEEWLGRGSKYAHSYNQRAGNETQEGLAEQAIPVMAAREIMEMPEKYAIILHRDIAPMKVYRLKWWQSQMLKKRQGLTPPVVPELPHIPVLPTCVIQSNSSLSSHDWYIDSDELLKERNKRNEEKEKENERRR